MRGQARFGQVVPAMVTPFAPDGSLDVDGAASLARWLLDQGCDGFVVAGTTGEAPVLSDEEHLALASAVRAAVSVPVVVGTGSNDTAHAIEMTKEAAALGADAVLVVSPYYNRPPQSGIEAHFRAVAGSVDIPVVLYDVPMRTGRRVDTDVVIRLANEVPNVLGFKDATGDVAAAARIVAETPDDFELYSGDDNLTLPFLSVGAVGVISMAAHWAAPEIGEMIRSFQKGEVDAARTINARLTESYAFMTGDTYVAPQAIKAMLHHLGQPAGACRLPLGPAPAGLEERAGGVLARLRS